MKLRTFPGSCCPTCVPSEYFYDVVSRYARITILVEKSDKTERAWFEVLKNVLKTNYADPRVKFIFYSFRFSGRRLHGVWRSALQDVRREILQFSRTV